MTRPNWLRPWVVALLLVCCAAVPAAAERLRIGGTGAVLGVLMQLGDAFTRSHPGAEVEIPKSLGSSGGIKALMAGALEVAVTSRPLKADERAPGLREIPLGRTPLALVTSRTDWTKGLTQADLVAYFGLQKDKWPDGMRLYIVLRPQSETDTRILAAELPGMESALRHAWETSELPLAFSDQDNLDSAERLRGSLAAAALCAVVTERRSVTPLALDGVTPTLEHLASGAYKLSRPFYLVLPAQPAPLAVAFVAFVQSPEGVRILRDTVILPGAW